MINEEIEYPRVLRTRKGLRVLSCFVLVYLITYLIILTKDLFYLNKLSVFTIAMHLGMIFVLTILSLISLYFLSFKIQIYENYLSQTYFKFVKKIYFDDIASVKLKVFKIFSGFIVLRLKQDGIFIIPAFFERPDYLTEKIEKVVNPEYLEEFKSKSNWLILSDHSLAFSSSQINTEKLLIWFLTFILIPLVFCYFIYLRQVEEFYIYSRKAYLINLFSDFLKLILFIQVTLFIGVLKKIFTVNKENLDLRVDKKRDMESEGENLNQFYWKSVFLLFVLNFLFFEFHLNTYELKFLIHKNEKAVSLKLHFFDSRFNCVECKYALSKNSFIEFEKDNVIQYGEILYLPREMYLGKILTKDQFVVKSWKSEETHVIKMRQISGKSKELLSL